MGTESGSSSHLFIFNIMIRYLIPFFTALFLLLTSFSDKGELCECRYSKIDEEVFEKTMQIALPDKNIPINLLVVKIANSLLGTPYVAGTLENDPEILTINLHETDCILFVEMCLSLALTAKSETPNFVTYCNIVRSLRYHNGITDGYASRNHYTSSWIRQGSENGIMREITKDIGGIPLDQSFSYMSTHSDSYRQLKENPSLVDQIRATEISLDSSDYYYIPQSALKTISAGRDSTKIRNGDIICFVSKVRGLDISHVSYAYWNRDILTFIHASFSEKKVVINSTDLSTYAKNGVRVVRLN